MVFLDLLWVVGKNEKLFPKSWFNGDLSYFPPFLWILWIYPPPPHSTNGIRESSYGSQKQKMILVWLVTTTGWGPEPTFCWCSWDFLCPSYLMTTSQLVILKNQNV